MSNPTSVLKVKTSGIDHVHLNVNQVGEAIELFTGFCQVKHLR